MLIIFFPFQEMNAWREGVWLPHGRNLRTWLRNILLANLVPSCKLVSIKESKARQERRQRTQGSIRRCGLLPGLQTCFVSLEKSQKLALPRYLLLRMPKDTFKCLRSTAWEVGSKYSTKQSQAQHRGCLLLCTVKGVNSSSVESLKSPQVKDV